MTCADGYAATIDGQFGHDNILCCSTSSSHTTCTGDYNACAAGGGPTTVLPVFTYTYALAWLALLILVMSCETHQLICSSPSACVTYNRFESLFDTTSLYSYACGDTATVITVLASPVDNGVSSTTTSQPTETSSPSQTSSCWSMSCDARDGIIATIAVGVVVGIFTLVCGNLWPEETKRFLCFICCCRRRAHVIR